MREPALIFFDGHCHLCCGSVQFILQRDRAGYFHYAPIDGSTAQAILNQQDCSAPLPDSIVLYEKGKIYTRSTAALRIAKKLSGGWPLLYVFMVIPAPVAQLGLQPDCKKSIPLVWSIGNLLDA